MEVHHHPDLHHNRKKFREYFLEFIMIFLAVTMGFFAEQIRETIANSHREKEFMESMLEDLKADSTEMQTAILFGNNIADGLDTLCKVLYDADTHLNVQELYRLNSSYTRLIGVNFSDKTSSQLKTGGMSYIKNRKVANAISAYWSGMKSVEGPQDNYKNRTTAAADFGYSIFNGKYVHSFGVDSVSHLSRVAVDSSAKLTTTDAVQLVGYANRIRSMRNILKTFYMRNLQKQFDACLQLTILIRREYNI